MIELSDRTQAKKNELYKTAHHIGFELGHKVAPYMHRNGWFTWSRGQKSVLKLIVVRHPFERLVSAFRQKVEAYDHLIFGWYGKSILKRRPEYVSKFGTKSLTEENNFGAILPVNGMKRTADLPTFWEFIQWIIKDGGSNRDVHWMPYFQFCAVCSFEYEYIIKSENYLRENIDFMKETGLDQYLSNFSVLENKVNVHRPEGSSR